MGDSDMFKVGDKVKQTEWSDDYWCEVIDIQDDRCTIREIKTGIDGEYPMNDKTLSWDVKPAGPVREVMRREIVPGNYGKVRVTEGRYVHCKSMSTAEELREAAHILNQIAEAME